jgi:hypothetical protein
MVADAIALFIGIVGMVWPIYMLQRGVVFAMGIMVADDEPYRSAEGDAIFDAG